MIREFCHLQMCMTIMLLNPICFLHCLTLYDYIPHIVIINFLSMLFCNMYLLRPNVFLQKLYIFCLLMDLCFHYHQLYKLNFFFLFGFVFLHFSMITLSYYFYNHDLFYIFLLYCYISVYYTNIFIYDILYQNILYPISDS